MIGHFMEDIIGSSNICEKLIGEKIPAEYRYYTKVVDDYIRQLTNQVDPNNRGDGVTYRDILQLCPESLQLIAEIERLYRYNIKEYDFTSFINICTRIIRDNAVRTNNSDKLAYVKILPEYKWEIIKDCQINKISVSRFIDGCTRAIDGEAEIITDHYNQFIDFNEDALLTDYETAAKIAVFIYWCNYRFPHNDDFVVPFKEIYWHSTLDSIF